MNDFFYIGNGNITEDLVKEFLTDISKDYCYFGHRCTKGVLAHPGSYRVEPDKCHIQYYNVCGSVSDRIPTSIIRVDVSTIESFIRDKKLKEVLD